MKQETGSDTRNRSNGENYSSSILHPSSPVRPFSLLSRLFIVLILLYRATLGHFLGGHCRYYPTCSQYAIDAIHKYGPIRGAWKAVRRIARCHPWGGKGYDPA